MRHLPANIGVLHFTGIGGIGMSGIAEILIDLGYKVQGSDIAENYNVTRLRKKGVKIFIGHAAENLQTQNGEQVSAVVVSSAVKPDNPEWIYAAEHFIPIVPRADMLAQLMRLKWTVAIGGTHGKTTTTSLVGHMLEQGDFDPTVINGGIVNSYGTNTRLGHGEWMVVEADESDGSFTRLPATVTVITNIDAEHMDHYGDFDGVIDAYESFVTNIPFYGFAVVCSDHPVVQSLIPRLTNRLILTYGFNPQADVQAVNIRHSALGSTFDILLHETAEKISDVFLPMLGAHNILNALASVVVAVRLKMPHAQIKNALSSFAGVKRRFTRTGVSNGITVIDDYGHHPVEITAVLKAARQAVAESGGKVIAVMQPHRYTRLQSLFDEFCTCFNDADSVIIADVYTAGESPIEGFDKQNLVRGIHSYGHRDVRALENPESLADVIAEIAQPHDFVICLGAGSITNWAQNLPGELDKIFAQQKKSHAG